MQGVPVGVVDGVMQHEVREGDVADRGVEEPVRDLRVREGLRVDRRVRVQQLGDPCGRLVELNAVFNDNGTNDGVYQMAE